MAAATFPNRVLEFFTLRETEREARSLPEVIRAPLTSELALAFQKREAAETLWPRGSMAEALKLARTALELVSKCLDALPEEERLAWVPEARALATETLRRAESGHSPDLERDVRPTDEETFRTLVDGLLALEDKIGGRLASPGEVTLLRRQRGVITGLVAAATVVLLGWLLHSPTFLHATASSQLSDYSPDNAIDGDTKTAWILPDHVASGWIDLPLGKPRAVSTLRVVSGNPPWNDRVVKDAHIEAFLNNVVVKAMDFTFPEPPGGEPLWTTVPLAAPTSDRIRITVKSNYKVSPAIAEVQVK